MVLGQLDSYMLKNEVRCFALHEHEHWPKISYRTKCKNKTSKNLQIKQRGNTCNLGLNKAFSDTTHIAQVTMGNTDNMRFIKIKNFCAASDPQTRKKYLQVIYLTRES